MVCWMAVHAQKWDEVVLCNAKWTPNQDDQLVRWAFTVANARSKPMGELNNADLASAAPVALSNYVLKDFSVDELNLRYATLKLFNLQLARCIDMIDMTNTTEVWGIAYKLRCLGHVIFADTKHKLVNLALEKSWGPHEGSGLSCTLDNQAAFQSMESKRTDPSTSLCLFVQGFNQLHRGTGEQFRCKVHASAWTSRLLSLYFHAAWFVVCVASPSLHAAFSLLSGPQIDSRGRLFGVSFAGEDGLDWGGLYRDAITCMVEDCFSARLDLLLPCLNSVNQQGQNMDKYLPNPRHTSPRAMKMLEFLGKLIGVSMRQALFLPFAFPSLIWKQLVGEPVTLEDVRLVDEATGVHIVNVKEMARAASREDFEREFAGTLFTITGADGKLVELLPGGLDMRVTWDTRDQYIKLAESYKIHEFDKQVTALRKGLVAVIPERALKLCTWQEFEVLVCGDPRIDVDVLKTNTTYHGYDSGDRACRYFWNVMRSLDDNQRSDFVRFAWGRCVGGCLPLLHCLCCLSGWLSWLLQVAVAPWQVGAPVQADQEDWWGQSAAHRAHMLLPGAFHAIVSECF